MSLQFWTAGKMKVMVETGCASLISFEARTSPDALVGWNDAI
jgi:hypothetical protein